MSSEWGKAHKRIQYVGGQELILPVQCFSLALIVHFSWYPPTVFFAALLSARQGRQEPNPYTSCTHAHRQSNAHMHTHAHTHTHTHTHTYTHTGALDRCLAVSYCDEVVDEVSALSTDICSQHSQLLKGGDRKSVSFAQIGILQKKTLVKSIDHEQECDTPLTPLITLPIKRTMNIISFKNLLSFSSARQRIYQLRAP